MWGGGGRYDQFPFGAGGFDDDFGGRGPTAPDGAFTRQFRSYPVSFIDRSDLEQGDKIVLPPSVLDTLTRLNITFPMLFKLSARGGRHTHCGVQEFVAEEGHSNLPYWLMQNLLVSEGSMISISNVNLPKGTFVKFQPQSSDFLNIANPKAVLEAKLRNFTCLTKGDTIPISYNDKVYHIDVKEVAPGDAISIIETDVNVEFEAPPDYVEPQAPPPQQQPPQQNHTATGAPRKVQIGGQPADASADAATKIKQRLEQFKKKLPNGDDSDSSEEDEAPKVAPRPLFPGEGQSLKSRTGRSMTLGGPSSSATNTSSAHPDTAPGSVDAKQAEDEKKPFVAFGGQGRSLR